MSDEILERIDAHLRALLVVNSLSLRKDGLEKDAMKQLMASLDGIGIAQVEIAAILGVNQSTVSRSLRPAASSSAVGGGG